MKLFVSDKALSERDRLTRLEAVLDAHDARMQAHEEDCLKIRIDTKTEITSLRDAMKENHEDWRKVVTAQHTDNIRRLRWQNGLLITVLLGLFGFLGEQVWVRLFALAH